MLAQSSNQLTLFAVASPARTSALRGKELALAALEAASGTSSLASLKKSVLDSSSSRTLQAEQSDGSIAFAETLDGLAMLRYRSRLALEIAELPTPEHAFSSLGALPTLTLKGNYNRK